MSGEPRGYGPSTAYAVSSAAVERTALAWNRTALALLVAAVVVARLTLDRLGPWGMAGAGLAILAGAYLLLEARRWRRPERRRGGATTLVLGLAVVGIGLVEIVAVTRP